MNFKEFIGLSNAQTSLRWDLQRTLNLFLQIGDAPGAKSPVALIGSPGLKLYRTLPKMPIRGQWAGGAPATDGGRLFAAAGDSLYEVYSATNSQYPNGYRLCGVIGDDADHSPVQIFSNGDHLFIISAGYAYLDPGDGPQKIKLTVTATKLVIHPSDSRKMVSLDAPFTAKDIGQFLDIRSGVNFTIQTGLPIYNVTENVRFELTPTVTDLVIDPDDTTKVASAGTTPVRPFQLDDVGKYMDIVAGTGFTVQTVQILQVVEKQRVYAKTFTALIIGADAATVHNDSTPAFASSDVGKTLEVSAGGRTAGASYTDLVIDSADATRISRAGGIFTESDAGDYLDVISGTGFTVQTAQILSTVAAGRIDVHTYSDLEIGSDSTKLSSADRLFTADDVGNSIDLSSTTGRFTLQTFAGDLAIDETDTTLLRAGYSFGSGDVGKSIDITGGTEFIVQTVTITSVDGLGGARCSSTLGTAGASGGSGEEWDYDGFLAQTARILSVDGSNVATLDRALGAPGATGGTGVEWTTGSWAQMDRAMGTLASTGGAANQWSPSGFTEQTVTILAVDGSHVATVDQPLGVPGTTHGSAVEYTISTVAKVDKPLGTPQDPPASGTGTLWLRTGQAELNPGLPATFGVAGASGGTGVQWEYLSAVAGAQLDNYFIAVRPESRRFYISPIELTEERDNLHWSPLDFGEKMGYPDHLVSILADHGYLYLFGDTTAEVWRDTGNASFPFERIMEMFIQQGCRAPSSPRPLANTVVWIGGSTRGGAAAFRARGWVPERISTHAVEQAWGRYPTVLDAETHVRLQEGHEIWTVHFPSADKTWEFDATVSEQLGQHAWTERSSYKTGGGEGRHRGRCHAYVFDKHLVGDYATGEIYEMSLDYFDDNSHPITRQRTCPHISQEELDLFYHRFQLDMDVGNGNSPVMTLDWTETAGKTWSIPQQKTAGIYGNGMARVYWNRLGRGRNRAFRVTSTAAIRHVWLAALINPNGNGQ